jgi:hypothetical protein
MKLSLINIVFFFLLALATSCQDQYNICEQNKNVEAKAGFYQKNGAVDVLTAPPQLSFGVLGSSTLLYNQATGFTTIAIGLNPGIDSAKFYVKTATASPPDTLTIFYSTQSINLSAECGNINNFTISNAKTTLNTLDSVKIINAAVNNVATENIKIYF